MGRTSRAHDRHDATGRRRPANRERRGHRRRGAQHRSVPDRSSSTLTGDVLRVIDRNRRRTCSPFFREPHDGPALNPPSVGPSSFGVGWNHGAARTNRTEVEADAEGDRDHRATRASGRSPRRSGGGGGRVSLVAAVVAVAGQATRRVDGSSADRGGRRGAGEARRRDARDDQPRGKEAMEGRRGLVEAVEPESLRPGPDRVHGVGATAGRTHAPAGGVRE